MRSDIQIAHETRVLLDDLAARLDLVAHEDGEELVRSLRIYSGRREAKQQVTAVAMIAALKEAGLWDYVPDPKCRKTDSRQKEVMYYQRNYIEPWHDNGWTAKAGSRSKYDLTEKGRNVIDTFHVGPRVGPS